MVSAGSAPDHRPWPSRKNDGTPFNAGLAHGAIGCQDRRGGLIACQKGGDLVAIEAGPCAAVRQHRWVADVAPLGEIGGEHRLHGCVLHAVHASQPNQPVRVERVRRPRHQVRAEHQTDTGGRGGDLGIPLAGTLGAAELRGAKQRAVGALLRHVRVKLERMPIDRGRQPVGRQQGERAFELPLADVAPRADCVRDDVDAQVRGRAWGVGWAVAVAHGVTILPVFARTWGRGRPMSPLAIRRCRLRPVSLGGQLMILS